MKKQILTIALTAILFPLLSQTNAGITGGWFLETGIRGTFKVGSRNATFEEMIPGIIAAGEAYSKGFTNGVDFAGGPPSQLPVLNFQKEVELQDPRFQSALQLSFGYVWPERVAEVKFTQYFGGVLRSRVNGVLPMQREFSGYWNITKSLLGKPLWEPVANLEVNVGIAGRIGWDRSARITHAELIPEIEKVIEQFQQDLLQQGVLFTAGNEVRELTRLLHPKDDRVYKKTGYLSLSPLAELTYLLTESEDVLINLQLGFNAQLRGPSPVNFNHVFLNVTVKKVF